MALYGARGIGVGARFVPYQMLAKGSQDRPPASAHRFSTRLTCPAAGMKVTLYRAKGSGEVTGSRTATPTACQSVQLQHLPLSLKPG